MDIQNSEDEEMITEKEKEKTIRELEEEGIEVTLKPAKKVKKTYVAWMREDHIELLKTESDRLKIKPNKVLEVIIETYIKYR